MREEARRIRIGVCYRCVPSLHLSLVHAHSVCLVRKQESCSILWHWQTCRGDDYQQKELVIWSGSRCAHDAANNKVTFSLPLPFLSILLLFMWHFKLTQGSQPLHHTFHSRGFSLISFQKPYVNPDLKNYVSIKNFKEKKSNTRECKHDRST